MYKCSSGVVWSEEVAPCIAGHLAMLPALKCLANIHRAFTESCEILRILQFRNAKNWYIEANIFKNACSFLCLNFTLFFHTQEATSYMQENCWNPWQNQEHIFGFWAPFPAVWTLDYALFSLAEAKAKCSAPKLSMQVMKTCWIMIAVKIKNSPNSFWIQILRI